MSALATELNSAAIAATVQQCFAANNRFADKSLVVALSGGADSVALLHLLASSPLKSQLRAIHINHRLQDSAPEWERFCTQLCGQLKLPITTMEIALDPQVLKAKGLEAAARGARYKALLSDLTAGDVLLTAHHAGDQLETVLFRLERGTGLQGLAGIPVLSMREDKFLLRPLLNFSKAELLAYLHAQKQSWVEDPSNKSVKYRRNVYRHHYVPQLPAAACGTLFSIVAQASKLTEKLNANHALWLQGRQVSTPNCLELEAEDFAAPALLQLRLAYWFQRFGFSLPKTVFNELIRQAEKNSALGQAPTYNTGKYDIFVKRRRLKVSAVSEH